MRDFVKGQGAIGDYLFEIFKDYREDQYGRSKVVWDMTAVAWLINDRWLPSNLVHSPILTDNTTLSFDLSRHFIRVIHHLYRDGIFMDFFRKLEARAAGE
jgi:hypothetical protein